MARKPSERRHRASGEEVGDVNLIPIMNLIVILIPFLLFVSSFIVLGMVNVSSYRLGVGRAKSEAKTPEKPPLQLTVAVTDEGFRLKYNLATEGGPPPDEEENKDKYFIAKVMARRCGGKLNGELCTAPKDCPAIKKPGGVRLQMACTQIKDYNYKKLNEEVARIKKLRPDEKTVIIMPESDISFGILVQVMDWTREQDKKTGDKRAISLFPEVVLGTGISY